MCTCKAGGQGDGLALPGQAGHASTQVGTQVGTQAGTQARRQKHRTHTLTHTRTHPVAENMFMIWLGQIGSDGTRGIAPE